MAFKYAITTWPTAGVSKLLATNGGAHILNVKATDDIWNGAIVGVGAYKDFEYYEEAAPTTFTATIVDKAANGNWYVQVESAENAFLVYNPPVVEAEWTKKFSKEENFYIAKGEIMRCHELKKYDIFELSANGFGGSTAPAKGDTISVVTGKKPVNVAKSTS